ncbi:MAG: hypothetical protein EBT48_00795 [Verrucomicrobia bacterium]|nr:hypothetical protein [Verrucomicrobiota bacterium]
MDNDFTSNPRKRDVIRVGMSGHSKELSMVEINEFNRKMDEFFHKRGLPSGEGFRGIISSEVRNAKKRQLANQKKKLDTNPPVPHTRKPKRKKR